MRPISAEASQGCSHLTSGTSKGSFTPLLQLKKFPDIPSPLERKHENLAHIQRSAVSASWLERRDPFTACSRKNCRLFRPISRGGALHRKGERNSRVVPPFPESPRCLSPFQGILFSLHCLDFQTEDRLTPRWHVGELCVKASWESLVGKPQGKAPGPLIHAKGRVTVLLQLGRKAQVHAPTRDED